MSDVPIPLRLSGVTKRFGRTVAVDAVDVELGAGELLSLVGPSGCGKSTLLRAIAGLHPIDEGRIEIGGEVVDDGSRRLDPERRHVGLVFQDHALFPHMTVRANVGFGVRGTSRRERDERVDQLLAMVGCSELADRYSHEISGGERQRVALARAVAPNPRLLLFDEPFASLDPVLRTGIRSDIVALLRATGTAAVFVTHDQTEALAIGDRVVVMRAGRVQQVGTPAEVYDRPRTRFVAAFMGEANLLDVRDDDGSIVTELGPALLPEWHADAPVDQLVALLRPNHLELVTDPQGGAVVTATEFRGATRAFTVHLDSGHDLHVTTGDDVELAVGTRVTPKTSPLHPPLVVRR